MEIAHRLAAREPIERITDVRGTAFLRRSGDESAQGWFEIDSSSVDLPGRVDAHVNPYLMISEQAREQGASCAREDEAQAVADAQNSQVKPIKFVRDASVRGTSPHPSPLPEGEGAQTSLAWRPLLFPFGGQHQPRPPRSCFLREGQCQTHIFILPPRGARIPTAPAFHPLPLGEGRGEGSRLTRRSTIFCP